MSEQLEKFMNMVREDKKRAKALFFSEAFKEEYLKNPEEKEIYHQLLMGRNREQIMEEFLISEKLKKPVKLSAQKREYRILPGHIDEPLYIAVKKEGWGYMEGEISTGGKHIDIERKRFCEEDFEDGWMQIPIYLNDFPKPGTQAVLKVATVYDSLEFLITYDEPKDREREKELSARKKLFFAYEDFCMGRITAEVFAQRGRSILDKISEHCEYAKYLPWIRTNFQILLGESPEGILSEEEIAENEPEDGMLYGYRLYLKACADRTEESINRAVAWLKQHYEPVIGKGFFLWFLMKLDKNFAYNEELQIEKMKEIYTAGERNPFLKFEAACLFGEEPKHLHRLTSFELEVLEFSAKEKMLNEKLVQRICFLVSREKTYSEGMLWLLICMYKEEPLVNILQGICALLIQGNCMEEDCHFYFEQAMKEGIQLIGLQEAFLRTIAPGHYPLLPEDILTYFTYSHSLSRQEQAFLYANIIKNRKRYQNLFTDYEEMIRPFLAEELEKGAISPDLSLLYHYYFEELLENEETREHLANVLFYHKLFYEGSILEKISVIQHQKKEADNRLLRQNPEYILLIDKNPMLLFFDRAKNRYIKSVNYRLEPVWTKEYIQAYEEVYEGNHPNFLLYQSSGYAAKERLETEDFPQVLEILHQPLLNETVHQQIFEKVLEYYLRTHQKEKLKEALKEADFKQAEPESRNRMIGYFIAGEMYEEALKGIQQYGYEFLPPDLLKEAALYALTTLSTRRSEMLVGMCSRALEQGAYNSETLGYLQKYFQGTKAQMLFLWEKGQESGMYSTVFGEKVLRACIAEGMDGTEFLVLSRYMKQGGHSQELLDAVLVEYVDYAYFHQKQLPEEFYELIGKKIDAGKTDRLYQGLYLAYYRNKNMTKQQKDRILWIRDLQLQTGDILPVLFEYSEQIELPKYLYAKTFIEYWGEEGRNLKFHYSGGRADEEEEVSMKELLPGYYAASEVMFSDEITDYYLKDVREGRRIRKDIKITNHVKQSRGSRFYELYEMIQNKNKNLSAASMETYAMKKQIVGLIQPMTED